MSFSNRILDEDFVITVRPEMDKKYNWTGEVNVFIMTSPDNPLNDQDYGGMLDFCRSLCATLELMEYDDDLRQKAMRTADRQKKEAEEENRPKLKIVDKQDNVVVLSLEADNDNKIQ